MEKLKIAVTGAAGRMGRELIKAVHDTPGCVLAGAVEQPGSLALGQDAGLLAGLGKLGVLIGDDALEQFAKVDAVLDFTVPAASVEFAGLAANARIIHVMGTTGLNAEQEAKVKAAARHATIIKSGNMSLGVNLLAALVKKVAAALDPDFDIEVLEMHHRHKIDAPSGTALLLGQAAADGRKVALADVSVRSRDGHTGARKRGDIGFATLRGGNVVGEHTVIFAADGERIELTHKASDRGIFTRGAVKAALWGRGKPPGLYDMFDVLGIAEAKG
ncbi:MAG: 4-hydroxy-tetrahydrodipicolinate reductase [Hyphomicrobiales bacterium]|nr:MAG: 4-hydroxy-tetrahydrodipicolinate reductase [Hyphomicrobiales bacterium]